MISVEKRRSSRKSGKHRKRSDTSSGGSFLDENDREVSSLTDRAFKSLCIGDEAVYNDSHLGLPSSSTHIDRQLAFSQGEPFKDEDERDELKRAAHQNFSLRVQQYGQDWVHEGMYGTATQHDPEWGVYGDRTQGRVSATFQNSFVETSQQGMSLREEELSFISNGAPELSLQQHRSRSRVSSLIRTFNSEVKRNGASMHDQFRGCNEETRWDKSALMNIHNEFSDFSSSYQQNLNINCNFPSAGPFSCRDANFYGSDMAAVAHMSHNSVSSFMRSSHNELSMSAQTNCNSHFFIHSEFSPFKVWREHNRFPFQQREVSGFMHSSEFPKWYETPMYKELSLENQLQGPYRGMRHSSNLAPRAPSNPSHFPSMSLMQHKASAVEKRSESELAGHYPQRRRTQSLGTNKLPSQRPSTASPTVEMSRRVRDTISSVKALQQKIKLMSEQNISAGMITHQETFGNHNLLHSGNNVAPNMVSSDISTTPFTISQLPSAPVHQDENTSGFQQHEPSPQPVEHPPVRAESRGVTPDGRLSSYKSRATSLLFNLKDNRKRVKSTYSPTKFKGLEKQEQNQQPSSQETVIDVPDFLDPDIQFMQQKNSRGTITAANQYQNLPLTLETQLERVNTGQYLENTSTDYQTAQVQGEMVCHSGFSGFIPGNYASNQLTNGQNRHEYLASFTPYKQGGRDNIQLQEGLQHPHTSVDTTRLNLYRSQSKDSLLRKAEPEQALNEPIAKIIAERDKYENLQDQINDYHNTSSNGNWQNCKDTEKVNLKVAASPFKQDPVHPMERLSQENQRNLQKEAGNSEAMDSLSLGSSSHKSAISNSCNFSNQPNAEKWENVQEMRDDVVLNYNRDQDPMRSNQLYPTTDKTKLKVAPIKTSEVTEKQKLQDESKPKFKNVEQEKSSLYTDNASESAKQFDEAKGEQVMAENNRVKAEMAAAQQRANAEQPKAETGRLILALQTDSETDSKAEAARAETLKQVLVKTEESEGELKEQAREKHPEGDQTAEKNRAWMSTDKSTGVLGKDKVREQGKHLKGEEKAEEKQPQMASIEMERIKESRTAKETEKTNNPVQAEAERLREKQAEGERMKTERVRTVKIQVEEAETKWKTNEKTEQTDDQNNKIKQTKIEEADNGRVTHVQSKKEKDSIFARQVNAEKSTACDFKHTKPEERKAEQLKQEERKVELSKTELLKSENLLEKSAKLTAKLIATQQVRNESDKVEHVKTELAKAKAELAKIKEKMRGEEKASNSVIVREDETLKNKKVDQKTQDQAVELKEDRVPDEYQRLREKYGFIHAISTHKNNTSASESDVTPASEEKMEKIEAGNNEDSKNVPSPASTFMKSDTQNTKEVINFRNSDSTEGKADNKSSKETGNEEHVADKLQTANVDKTQTINSKIDNITPQSNSELAKLHPQPNLAEHSKSTGKEPPIAFPKTLPHKEKAQTKQEILTSKIKAHAEKEISALKEKGFSLSKNSSKQFVGSQNFNARQKPLSQDAPKRPEGVVSNYVSPKHPPESSDIKTEQEFARTTTQDVDCLEKPRKTNNSANNINASTESSEKRPAEVKLSIQNTEQTAKNDQQKQQEYLREESKKQTEEVEDQLSSKEIINNGIEGQAARAESKSLTVKNAAREGNTHNDAQPPNTALGQTDFNETNDSLKIMGIMVTVREGKPHQISDKTQMESTKKEANELELDKRRFSPGTDGNTYSKEMNSVKAVDGQKSYSLVNEGVAKAVENIDPEPPKETLSLEAKDISVRRAAIEKTMNLQQGNPTPELLSKPDLMKVSQLIKTDAQKSEQQIGTDLISNVVTSGTNCHTDVDTSSKKLAEEVDGIKCLTIDVHSAPEESTHDSAKPISNATPTTHSTEHEEKPLDVQNKDNNITENSHGEDNLHIDCIAIRVVPAVTENDIKDVVEKPLNTTFPSNTSFALDKQQTAASSHKTNGKQCSENASCAISENRMNESLENNLAVQHVLSSVRKLSDLMKMNNKASNLVSETAEAKAETLESNVEPNEVDYFQVQGQAEANTEAQNNCTTVEATPKKIELLDTPHNKRVNIEDSPKDGQSEVFVFHVDPCLKKDLISEKLQNNSIKKLEAVGTPSSKMSSSSFEPCNKERKVDAGQATHTGKSQSENQLGLSATDKESSRTFPQTKAEKVTAKPEVKPKPKDKISAIPEISAIADYARLKVIVSEDKELNTAQDFPPSKKEGFFPLIRGHHSRRPVFTTDLHGYSVKENKPSTKTDVSAKASKEPKATIFPITEREHQRTGMFKLGDKDKQEKMLLEMVSTQTEQVNEVEIQENPSKTGEPITQPLKSSSSSVSSGPTSRDLTYFDKSLPLQGALGERRLKEDTTYLRKHENPEEQLNGNHNNEAGRSDQLKKERLANQVADNKMMKLDKGNQLDEELIQRNENRQNNVRIKHIIEESRASLAEEERRVAQREEEKRTKEREAIAQMIRERRGQQRQAEEESNTTNTEDKITGQNAKDFQTKQIQEQTRITETKKCRFGDDEQLKRTVMEQQKTTQDKQQSRAAMEHQWRNAQEEKQQSAAKEQLVKTPLEQQIKRESDVQGMKIIQEKQQQVEQQNTILQKEHQQMAAEGQVTRFVQEEKQIVTIEQQQLKFSKEEENKRSVEDHQKGFVQIEHQKIQEEQKQKATGEQQKKRAEEEKQRRVVEEQQRKTASEELLRRSTEKHQWRTTQEEQQKSKVKEEGMRLHQEGQQKRTSQEQQRQLPQKEQQKGEVDEQQRRVVLKQQRRTTEEKQRMFFHEEHQRKSAEEQQRSHVKDEHQIREAEQQQRKHFQEEQQRKAAEEQRRKLFQEEQQRKVAEEQQRKLFQEEKERKAAEEQQRKLFQEEQQRKVAEEQQRKIFKEEQQRKLFQKEQQRKAAEEQQRRHVQEEQQRKAAEEQQRRNVQEEHQKRADEQLRKLFQEEQQRKAVEEPQRRRVQEEQQRQAAEEQQRRHVQEQRRISAEEKQRKLFQEEQQRKAAEEQQRRHVQEEQQKRAAQEQQQRLFQEEQEKRVKEEQQRRLFQEEQKRRAEKEQQKRLFQEKQQTKAAEEHQKTPTDSKEAKFGQEEQVRGAAEEQETTIPLEEERQRIIEKQQKIVQEEQQRISAKGEQHRRVAEQISKSTLSEKVHRKEQRTDENAVNFSNMGIQQMPDQEKEERQIEKLRRRRSLNNPLLKTHKDEGVMMVDEKEITLKPEEKILKDHSAKPLEEKRVAEELFGEKAKQKEENTIIYREKTGVTQAENQKQIQKMNGLQYYAFTSADTEGKSREKQLSSLLHSEQKSSPVRLNSPDDSVFQTKSPRPLPPASPASSLPRSNTSSPALGAKPSMFKVKDNTIRSSSFIKSVKPRFHKNFGEDFLVASPLDRLFEKGEDEREKMRSGAGTPVHTEIGMRRIAANTEFSTLLSSSSMQDFSVSHHRPYSRRSIVLDDDESRSVISNLSEDVESYATSAADVGDVRGLFDFERPESACSYSSDVSRSLGKPPVVPPKTEKALRRAQRLTSRRMKKEQSKVAAGGDKETSSVPSSSTETYQSNSHAVASPHFSQPVSLAHAPVLGSSLPSSSSELQSVPRSFHSSPHATAPVSLPVLPNATSTVSLPTVSPHTSGTVPQPTAPKPVPNAPSSSTLHHANHPTPVAQYHVESSCFSQSYPMTQRKVLQDLGSGQYYVVDVPVQVQTKTFFDPETGKYVQLNVRESGQSVSRPHTQQTQPNQIKLQPQPLNQTPAAGKPFVLYQRYHSYPQNYQPTAATPVRRSRSSAPGSLQPNPESLSDSCSYGNIANKVEQNSVEPCYSPEKTPYMDTVIDMERSHNSVKSTQNTTESASECGRKSQTDGNSFHENHEMGFQNQGRDIISMGELEDFMETSDW